MLYAELPAFIGGSRDLACEYLNRAIACDSNYTASYIDLARILIKEKNIETAHTLCCRMLAVGAPTDAGENVMYDRPAAQKILKEIEGN
jgi:Tfp pilus assembly protein PilF